MEPTTKAKKVRRRTGLERLRLRDKRDQKDIKAALRELVDQLEGSALRRFIDDGTELIERYLVEIGNSDQMKRDRAPGS